MRRGRVGWQMRKTAESLMRSVVRVERVGDATVVDPVTLSASRPRTVLYEGRGRVTARDQVAGGGVLAADASVTITRHRVHIPFGVAVVEPGDLITVVSNGEDPALEGRVFRAVEVVPVQSSASAYRIDVEAVDW